MKFDPKNVAERLCAMLAAKASITARDLSLHQRMIQMALNEALRAGRILGRLEKSDSENRSIDHLSRIDRGNENGHF
jgi:hypothetical protein